MTGIEWSTALMAREASTTIRQSERFASTNL